MNFEVITSSFAPPPYDDNEIFRYTGCRDANENIKALLEELKGRAQFVYRACYTLLPLTVTEDGAKIGHLTFKSRALAERLLGCGRAAVFVATVGVGAERLISRYSDISESRELLAEAIGNERVEALCDAVCREIEEKYGQTKKRFSPGYFDLSIEYQRDIFSLLAPEKRIGVCLTDTLLMTPRKSVSAIVGIK